MIEAKDDIQRIAKQILDANAELKGAAFAASVDPLLDPSVLLGFARLAHSVSFQDDNDIDDEEIFRRSCPYFAKADPVMQAAFISPPFQIRWLWAARWFQSGMPRVVWEDGRLPASLMMTKADPDVLGHVIAPWPAFIIDLPVGLLTSKHEGEVCSLEKMVVQLVNAGGKTVWNYLAFGPKIELWRHGLDTKWLVDASGTEMNSVWDKVDAQDEVTMNLLGRLIVGLCLTLSDPSRLREAKHTKANRSFSSKFKRDVPKIRNFVVGGRVTHDCSEAVRDALQDPRKRATPAVQILVRGHWKMQAYGPQHSLRKPIHIEPYWRGPEDAPILVHDHEIETPDRAPEGVVSSGHEPEVNS